MFIRSTHILMRALGAVLTIATLLTALALWRFASGPVSLSFLGTYLQEMLEEATPGYRWAFDEPILDWTDLRPSLEITITGVKISETAGRLVAQAPRLVLGISARGLILARIAPTSVELNGASLTLVRLLDGSFRLGVAAAPEDLQQAAPPDISALLSRAFAALLEAPGLEGNMGALESLAIRNVALIYRDLRTGSLWEASNASFSFVRSAQGINGEAAIGLKIDEQTWQLSLSGNFDQTTQLSQIDVSFSGVEPFRLADEAEALAQLANIRLPISGLAGMQLAGDGKLLSLSANILAGAGEIILPDVMPEPVQIDSLEIMADYTFKDGVIRVGSAILRQGPLEITAKGFAEYGVASPAIQISGGIKNASIETVKRLWPIPAAKGSRGWFLENMDTGMINNAHFEANITRGEFAAGPLSDGAVKVEMQFKGVTGHYLRPMPPITQGRGSALITGRQFELTLDEGTILDELHLTGGNFILANTHLPEKDGVIKLLLNGSVTKTMALIDFPPLGYPSRFGIDPAALSGGASTQVELKLPISNTMRVSDIQYEITSEVNDLRLPNLLNGVALEQADVNVRVNAKGIEVTGAGRFLDAGAELAWSEKFNVKEGPSSNFTVKMNADEHQLEAFGFPTAGLIAGPVNLQVEAWGRGTKISGGHLTAGLEGAELVAEPLSWSKPKALPATLTFDFAIPEDSVSGPVLNNFTVTGKEIDVLGRVVFVPHGPPGVIRMDRLKLGPNNDLSGEARRMKNGAYAISMTGPRADLSRSIAELRSSGGVKDPAEKGLAYDIDARVKQVLLRDGNILNDVIAIGSYDGDDFINLAVDGNYGPERGMALRLEPGPSGNRVFTLISLDAGKILYGLDLFDSGRNGDLEMKGEFLDQAPRGPQEEAPMQGEIRIRNMQVVNAPALTRILTIASLTGIRDILTGGGLTFERILVPFKMQNGIVTLKDAYGSGSELGLTLHGTRNEAAGTVKMNGTVIPAYTLNTVFGKVPLVGKILLGGKNEGVFAINYSASGSSENPDIFVNPLSALTPGFLRQIDNLGDQDIPSEQQTAPASNPAPQE
ncbi:MAG: AsmA-like C-terminal region-containing protein [Alphaproteobacteria bacterium]